MFTTTRASHHRYDHRAQNEFHREKEWKGMPVQQDVFFVHKQDLTMREELCKANSQCNWWLVKNTAATGEV